MEQEPCIGLFPFYTDSRNVLFFLRCSLIKISMLRILDAVAKASLAYHGDYYISRLFLLVKLDGYVKHHCI